jgi:hypothetical protein
MGACFFKFSNFSNYDLPDYGSMENHNFKSQYNSITIGFRAKNSIDRV